MNQYTNETQETKEKRAMNKVAMYAPSFEYAGNYGGSEGYVDIRCKVCGTVQSKAMITLRQRHTRCEVCYRKDIEADRAKKRQAKDAIRAKKAKDKAEREWTRFENSIKQESLGVCCECGNVFVKRFDDAVCCSSVCSRRHQNNKKDRRLIGVAQDRGITLTKVYDLDDGVCYLCGRACDWEDIEDRDGVMVAGDNYPSIDHVIPLAKGGTHTWNNVRLAHRKCNIVKSDAPVKKKRGV